MDVIDLFLFQYVYQQFFPIYVDGEVISDVSPRENKLLLPFDEVDNTYVKIDLTADGTGYILLEIFDTGLSVAGLLRERGGYSMFLLLVARVPSIAALLENAEGNELTVFPPTDAAFAALDRSTRAYLASPAATQADLTRLLGRHIVTAQQTSTYTMPSTLSPLAGAELAVVVSANGENITVGGARIVMPNNAVDAAAVHGIDAVLLPDGFVSGSPHPLLRVLALADTEQEYTLATDVAVATGLNSTLAAPGNYTLFAPRATVANLSGVYSSAAARERVLLYHVVPGEWTSEKLFDGQQLPTLLAGHNLTVHKNASSGAVTLTGEQNQTRAVLTADLTADNGVVHLLDGLLLPANDTVNATAPTTVAEWLQSQPTYSILRRLLQLAGLMPTLQALPPFTLLAPDDAAFLRLPSGVVAALEQPAAVDDLRRVLLYHVIPSPVQIADLNTTMDTLADVVLKVNTTANGSTLLNGNARITANMTLGDNVVHSIDNVLVPIAPTTPAPTMDIIALLAADPANHSVTLLRALDHTGLTEVLQTQDPLTLLAPTEEAWAAVPAQVQTFLFSAAGRDQLRDILLYHVFGAHLHSKRLTNGDAYRTLYRDYKLTVQITDDGKVRFGATANVVEADLFASNGVVHRVDAVLLPPMIDTVADVIAREPIVSVLNATLAAAPLLQATLDSIGEYTVFAPVDRSFESVPESAVAALLQPSNIVALTALLSSHVVLGTVTNASLTNGTVLTTLADTTLHVAVMSNGSIMLNDTRVSTDGLMASNGVVYLVEGVLSALPVIATTTTTTPATSSTSTTSTPAATTTPAANTTAPPASNSTANATNTTTTTPPPSTTTTTAPTAINASTTTAPQTSTAPANTTAATVTTTATTVTTAAIVYANTYLAAAAAPALSKFAAALQTTGLDVTLAGGTYTVFAPPDDAFTSLGERSDYVAGNISSLRALLQLHIVSGDVPPTGLANGDTLTTLSGRNVTVRKSGGTLLVDHARVSPDPALVTPLGRVLPLDTFFAEATTPGPTSPSSGKGSSSSSAVAGAIGAVIALIAIVVVVVAVRRRSQRRDQSRSGVTSFENPLYASNDLALGLNNAGYDEAGMLSDGYESYGGDTVDGYMQVGPDSHA